MKYRACQNSSRRLTLLSDEEFKSLTLKHSVVTFLISFKQIYHLDFSLQIILFLFWPPSPQPSCHLCSHFSLKALFTFTWQYQNARKCLELGKLAKNTLKSQEMSFSGPLLFTTILLMTCHVQQVIKFTKKLHHIKGEGSHRVLSAHHNCVPQEGRNSDCWCSLFSIVMET